MGLCEKVQSFESEIRGQLEVDGYARILNLQYSKDTGQFNVQLQETLPNGKKKKGDLKSVVLPESVAQDISDYVLSKAYPYFEAKQAALAVHKRWEETGKTDAVKPKIKQAIQGKSAEITAQYKPQIDDINSEASLAILKLQNGIDLDTITAKDYKAIQGQAEELRAAADAQIGILTETIRNKIEEESKSITKTIQAEFKAAMDAEIKPIYDAYGIEAVN